MNAETAYKISRDHSQASYTELVNNIFESIKKTCQMGGFVTDYLLLSTELHLVTTLIKDLEDEGYTVDFDSSSRLLRIEWWRNLHE